MARRKHSDIRAAMQKILDTKTETESGKLTGAEIIAMTLYQQATDPQSRNWGKANEIIVKLNSEKEQLLIEKLKADITRATAPDDDFYSDDPFTAAIKQDIRERATGVTAPEPVRSETT